MSLDHTVESTSNVQYFMYEHSPSYRQVQLKFLKAVESLNPESIVVRYLLICVLREELASLVKSN